MSAPDATIIGGGIIGLSSALELHRRGFSIRILDPSGPGSGASWAAGGMLGVASESDGATDPFAVASRALYEGWVASVVEETGVEIPLLRNGTLLVARDAAEAESLQGQVRRWPDACWLEADALSEASGALRLRGAGGALLPDEWAVDNRALVRALILALERRGVEFRRAAARAVHADASPRVTTDEGTVETGLVVLAAGAWSQTVTLPGDARVPVSPVRGEMVQVRAPGPAPRVVRWSDGHYAVPRGEHVLLGATQEEVGFDDQVTAAGIASILERSVARAPGLAVATVTDQWAGLRPGSPDGRPILGVVTAGVIAATGHFRNGILLAPITARVVGDLAESGQTGQDIAHLQPARFEADGRVISP